MTPFMHKTCTERTKTFLIHRTIDEVPFFAISRHLYRVPGVQKWPIWDQKWPNMAGLPMPRCGPKGSQMVPNGQNNIFLTIWDIFGLIWTLLDLLRQKLIFCLKNTKCFLVKVVSAKLSFIIILLFYGYILIVIFLLIEIIRIFIYICVFNRN